MVLAAVVMSPSSALALSATIVAQVDAPPITAAAQVDAPPVAVPVVGTRLDPALPPVVVPVSLPPLQELLPPPSQSPPAVAPPAASRPAPPPAPAPGSVPSEPIPQASSSGPLPTQGPVETALAGSGIGPSANPSAIDFPGEAGRTARRFWFPMTMAAVIMVFLVVQWFVDRRDPKLAASPLSDELLEFA